MKTILVTGSNGLLGQKLTSLICGSGRANLIATSRGANRNPLSEGYLYVQMNISEQSQIKEVISTYKPDVVINTAAITNVDICHIQRELCTQVNVTAVEHLAKICKELNIHLIHLSTDFVFDGNAGPYSEDALPNPLSFYGESKVQAEQVIRDSGCKWAIIRTILVYGITASSSRSNIVLWAKSSLEKGAPIKVVNDQWRMPTLAEDLAEGCLLTAEKEATGIFHISGKDMMSVYELVQQVGAFWNLDTSLIQPVSSATLNQEAKRPLKTGFILDKAIRELGYKPHSFLEGLKLQKMQIQLAGI
ncbi:SDR family oxidoreductase [Desertivirga xinjiangensis]|uniref:SDR family oxidoreductase n=1 Tax=Desertivirga xinjiangensis TaxID=539206 RepID=UPI00210BC7AB|nr:SDR family oxidoreductase [Pedobacter xinjiangensis]